LRKFFYLMVFLIGFFSTFLMTFPAKTIAGYFLTENNISYSKIEGNLFSLKIYDIEYKKLYIPKLFIENNFVNIISKINMENFFKVNFLERKAKLKLTDLPLENYQKNPVLKGKITTSIKFTKNGRYILTKGNGKLLIKEFKKLGLRDIQVNWKLAPEDKKSKISAEIHGKNINGTFTGKLRLPVDNTKDVRIKGIFKGKVFGRPVTQEININPFLLEGF